jgi:HSP20 family protein
MNIQHTGNVFTVTLELPGLQKEEVDISVSKGILTVSGEFVGNTSPNAPESFNIPPGYEAEGFEMMDESGETLYDDGQELEDGIDTMNLNANQPDFGGFVLRERRFGPFKRSIKLPAWVDVDAIKATMAHGVLSLVVEKPEEEERGVPAKKINVL